MFALRERLRGGGGGTTRIVRPVKEIEKKIRYKERCVS